jgi:hypothetical protein
MNNPRLSVVLVALFMSVSWSASAADAGTPVDFRACHFRDGKTMKDLDKITEKFRGFANKNDIDYAAWTLTPQYQTGLDLDVAWLGAWPSGDAFGVSMEKWNKNGRGLQAEFDQVIDCTSRHEMSVSYPINAPEGTPQDGVWLFYACKLNEGVSIPQALAAHLEAGRVMKEKGSLSLSWMMVPGIGAGPTDVDYYHALVFYRYSDLGSTMEMFVNNGGQQARAAILDKVRTCNTPTLFEAASVRAYDER